MFFDAIHGIIETVDKIKDKKELFLWKKEIEMEKAGFFKKNEKRLAREQRKLSVSGQ